jgi:hypothetical protein
LKTFINTKFQDPTLSGAQVTPISDIHTAAKFIFLMVEKEKVQNGMAPTGMMFIPSFIKIYQRETCA